jgi:putative transposase
VGAAPFALKGAGFVPHRNPLRRFYGQGDLHFITFSCYRRRPLLGDPRARDCFVKVLDEVRSRHCTKLIGYVVMPEHVHLLIAEPLIGNPSTFLQVLKQNASHELSAGLQLAIGRHRCAQTTSRTAPLEPKGAAPSLPVAAPAARAFWQRRFFDLNVWNPKKIPEKLDYMHFNPLKRKLVDHPEKWPWSSWSHYATGKGGLIPIDSLQLDFNQIDSLLEEPSDLP